MQSWRASRDGGDKEGLYSRKSKEQKGNAAAEEVERWEWTYHIKTIWIGNSLAYHSPGFLRRWLSCWV
jgi:hypothetical protein